MLAPHTWLGFWVSANHVWDFLEYLISSYETFNFPFILGNEINSGLTPFITNFSLTFSEPIIFFL